MRWPAVFAVLAALPGCGEAAANRLFDGLPLDGEFIVGLDAQVHVARDRYGMAHIAAGTLGDAAFVQGYVVAHDRLLQMDLLRRFGAGTLAELYGAMDPSVIDTDLVMRFHRMAPLAARSWDALRGSQAAVDRQVVVLLSRYADGVNAYLGDLRRGIWTADPDLAASLDPAAFTAWSPVDSLVILRFLGLAASWSVPFEVGATELYQKLRATYDSADPANPAAVARRGISRDLFKLAPVGTASTIAGFPNVAVDTGSRADGSAAPALAERAAQAPSTSASAAAAARPEVPQAVLDAAAAFLAEPIHDGPFGALGPGAFGSPLTGGNAWAVGPALAGGSALLAADQQLPLTNPPLFYPTHLIVASVSAAGADPPADPAPGAGDTAAPELDAIGATVPGIPGVIAGTSGALAWAATAAEHDENDVYLEQIAPCPAGGGDCVAWTDPGGAPQEVPIERVTEDIAVGTLGAITGHVMATYEVVPHHGPILPEIDRTHHALVPRTAAAALSVRSTANAPSFEIRALYQLARAGDVHAGFAALADVTSGGQSYVLIDDHQHIGWTTQAAIPIRVRAAYAWDPLVRQDAPAPFFVLPGDGSGDWIAGAALSPRYIPHAVDPVQGTLVTANADPVGATLHGLPLDQAAAQAAIGGQPLYAGVRYAAGLREDRITELLRAHLPGAALTLDDMARIQTDTRSTVGERLVPAIRAALDRLDSPTGAPADLAGYVAQLSPADRARLATARALLGSWTLATPPATDAPDPDSAATALFNTWIHAFIGRALGDELAAIGWSPWRLDDGQLVRIVHALLVDPRSMVTSPTTQEPVVCADAAASGPDTSCTVAVLAALLDAMVALASPDGFGTADTTAWRWGQRHRLAIAPIVPDAVHALPAPGAPDPGGFPRPGDEFAIDRADPGWADPAFAQRTGAALRLLAEARPGRPIALGWALPGGAVYDRRSPHYRDLLDRTYLTGEHVAAPYSIDDIVAAGESRWVFH